ncbi:hypothetical protein N7495_005805 [Penicillium taxi]|uniref:uncharacterized protein n=1 Tax=Penicillium taxi TaxID=168475 RepID=UPI002545514A|nr:uncharacterized protein N7495_005805 [Penicillium taxi]KAJ5894114.1 hypothetical protein N7495_005805 [Penicillium taxi]
MSCLSADDYSSSLITRLSPRVPSPFSIPLVCVTTTSANDFDQFEQFQADILQKLLKNTPGDHLFTKLPPEWGSRIFKEIDEIYPCR